MNDKLQDLMYQAGLTAQGCWDEMDNYDHTAIEKFAKLIVRECADVIDDIPAAPQGTWSDGYYEGCRDSAKVIRMHFEPAPIRQVTIEESMIGPIRQVTIQESMMEEVLLQERLNKE
jgi:hypothetical protein